MLLAFERENVDFFSHLVSWTIPLLNIIILFFLKLSTLHQNAFIFRQKLQVFPEQVKLDSKRFGHHNIFLLFQLAKWLLKNTISKKCFETVF
jgi:hypothetical protein